MPRKIWERQELGVVNTDKFCKKRPVLSIKSTNDMKTAGRAESDVIGRDDVTGLLLLLRRR